MLLVGSALKGYAIAASDGQIGTVSDFLFDDRTWKVRWLVVDTGTWLSGRMVLIHPSAIGQADYERRQLPVALTMAAPISCRISRCHSRWSTTCTTIMVGTRIGAARAISAAA
jgi:hypothetical protein